MAFGHLGVQFSRAMGFETVAIARGPEREAAAKELGAHHYIDSTTVDVAAELQRLGGAVVVLATAASATAMAATVAGLAPEGQLVTVGVTPRPCRSARSTSSTVASRSSGIRRAPRAISRRRCTSPR